MESTTQEPTIHNASLRKSKMTIFRAPIQRGMKVLNRDAFTRKFPAFAAAVPNPQHLPRVKKECWADMLSEDDKKACAPTSGVFANVVEVKHPNYKKVVTLHPRCKADDLETLSPPTQKLLKDKIIELIPHIYTVDYYSWTADELLQAILPEEYADDLPSGYAIIGHLAHLNLREKFLPYKHIIAQVIADHQQICTTVINKINDVGSESVFRTFPFEVLVAPKDGIVDTNVEVKAQDCKFKFDFAKVYWNTRLETEHRRQVSMFKPGEVVCDVMAGVGPFAIPAAKKQGVLVWANDLNPDCFRSLLENQKLNKLWWRMRSFNMDGKAFIQSAPEALIRQAGTQYIDKMPGKRSRGNPQVAEPPKAFTIPATFSHFIMNLPNSAIEFLPAYKGIYHKQEKLFTPHTNTPLPLIHLHLFHHTSEKDGDIDTIGREICARISEHLGHKITLDRIKEGRSDVIEASKQEVKEKKERKDRHTSKGPPPPPTEPPVAVPEVVFREDQAMIQHVRTVAPKKIHYVASFRVPKEIAFADPDGKEVVSEEQVKEMKAIRARMMKMFELEDEAEGREREGVSWKNHANYVPPKETTIEKE